jgi:hypothetical protein
MINVEVGGRGVPCGRRAKVLAEDLARCGLGDDIDEPDPPDLLVRGDLACDQLDHFVCGEAGSGPADNEGLGYLLAVVAGDADDRGGQ